MKKILVLALLCLGVNSLKVRAEDSLQIVRYVNAMARYAVSEMHRSGVPASVSLAQGILETAAGTSPLYSRSNNNFGIKCKANWNGPYTLHDDDAKGECFRVYDNDSLSYVDHSNFLRTAPRYDFLFQLDKTDFRGWAIGLKKAGYATNPKYSMKLIEYIEKYNLDAYDHLTLAQLNAAPKLARNASQALNTSRQASVINLPTSNTNTAAETPAPTTAAPAAASRNSNAPVNGFDPNNLPEVHWNVTNIPDGDASHVTYKPKPKPRYNSNASKHTNYNRKASVAKKATHTVNAKASAKSKNVAKAPAKNTSKASVKAVSKKAPAKKK